MFNFPPISQEKGFIRNGLKKSIPKLLNFWRHLWTAPIFLNFTSQPQNLSPPFQQVFNLLNKQFQQTSTSAARHRTKVPSLLSTVLVTKGEVNKDLINNYCNLIKQHMLHKSHSPITSTHLKNYWPHLTIFAKHSFLKFVNF